MTSRASKLKIVVSGLTASYPFGGVFWDYFQYVIGFHLLGHDVLYVEDTGQWAYDPERETFVENGLANAEYLNASLSSLPWDLTRQWYYRDAGGNEFGLSRERVYDFCRDADLFLNISGSCRMRDEYFRAKVAGFIDSDPMYTQAQVPEFVDGTIDAVGKQRIEAMLRHDVFFTFGENINSSDCCVPKDLFDWIPTRQPVLFDYLYAKRVPVASRRRVFTTIGSTEPSQKSLVVRGIQYFGKSRELARFANLPRCCEAELELAMSGPTPASSLAAEGWRLAPAYSVSKDPWVYLDYLSHSLGEWSVAKNAYVASRSGWFSCRTACYLALSVPAVVQDTGFSRFLPAGEGVIPFTTLMEAAQGLEQVSADPVRHSGAAAAIAREHFDYRVVLPALIDRAFRVDKSFKQGTPGASRK